MNTELDLQEGSTFDLGLVHVSLMLVWSPRNRLSMSLNFEPDSMTESNLGKGLQEERVKHTISRAEMN